MNNRSAWAVGFGAMAIVAAAWNSTAHGDFVFSATNAWASTGGDVDQFSGAGPWSVSVGDGGTFGGSYAASWGGASGLGVYVDGWSDSGSIPFASASLNTSFTVTSDVVATADIFLSTGDFTVIDVTHNTVLLSGGGFSKVSVELTAGTLYTCSAIAEIGSGSYGEGWAYLTIPGPGGAVALACMGCMGLGTTRRRRTDSA